MTVDPHGVWRYVPITERPDYVWPNGARLAVYVAFGIEEYHYGRGLTENLIAGVPLPDLVNTSWRDYGNRVAGFRVLDRLSGTGIRPAILLNTAVYDTAPQLITACRAAGAEFIAHGITNSDSLATLSSAQEREYIAQVLHRIGKEEGVRPAGWSSPWLAHGANTLAALRSEGVGYLLDLHLDDQPVWLDTPSGRLLSLPYGLEINDSSTVIGRYASASEFQQMIVDEFDELLEASREQPLVMSIVVHSFITGQPFRLRAFMRAIEHIVGHRDRVWLARPGDIAAFIGQSPHLAV